MCTLFDCWTLFSHNCSFSNYFYHLKTLTPYWLDCPTSCFQVEIRMASIRPLPTQLQVGWRQVGLFMYIQGKQQTALLLVNHCDCKVVLIFVCHFFYTKNCCSAGSRNDLQYNGSNDDLDWRIDFKYLNFVCFIKYLISRVIKDCFIEWKCLRLSTCDLTLSRLHFSKF